MKRRLRFVMLGYYEAEVLPLFERTINFRLRGQITAAFVKTKRRTLHLSSCSDRWLTERERPDFNTVITDVKTCRLTTRWMRSDMDTTNNNAVAWIQLYQKYTVAYTSAIVSDITPLNYSVTTVSIHQPAGLRGIHTGIPQIPTDGE